MRHPRGKACGRRESAASHIALLMLLPAAALAQQPGSSNDPATLTPVTVTGTTAVDAETDGTATYKPDAVTIGTKLPTRIRDIPQSITVLTQERIRDQNLRTNQEVLQQVPSVSNAFNPEGFITIRGFSAKTLINGVPSGGLVGRTQVDMAVFDRMEILKGPAGLMSGAGSPGGAINYEFKKPRHGFHAEATLGLGSDSIFNTGLDVTGPLNADGTLRARGVIFRDKRDEFVNVEKRERTSAYGVLEYDFTPSTTASLGYYQQKNKGVQGFRQGLPAYTDGGLLWDVDRRTSITQDWSDWRFKADWLLADIKHQISEDWVFKASYRQGESGHPSWYQESGSSGAGTACALIDPKFRNPRYSFSGVVRGNPLSANQCYHAAYYNDVNRYKDADAFVAGKFRALGRQHDLVVGANWERSSFERSPFVSAPPSQDFVNNPFYANPHVINAPLRPPVGGSTPSVTRTYGSYLRATLALTDWLKMPVGGRLTWSKNSSGATIADKKFTPYVGLVAEINDNVSVYASYTEIFNPNSARAWSPVDPNGTLLPPQSGEQYEIGVKSTWLDDRLLATAAVYNLELNNTTRSDPDHTGFSLPTGQQRTRGFEFDVQGEVQRGWNVGAAYAYMDARYTSADGPQMGARVSNVPRHSANVYTNYRFAESSGLGGLSLGGGLRYVSRIQGDIPGGRGGTGPRLQAPGYTTAFLRAGYRINRTFDVSVNVENLFDKKYWQQIGSVASGNYYGSPRAFTANLRAQF